MSLLPLLWGVLSLSILFGSVLYISITLWSASIIASFGMLSGPMLFPRLSCLIDCLISLVVIGFGSGSFTIVLSVSFTVCCMCYVQCSYSSFPGRAWYRSRKYSLMCFLLLLGSLV